jgi:YegS/Rv2252/BmrU family lipid kinase
MTPIEESEILFIVNPNSGRRSFKRIVRSLMQYDVAVEVTLDPDHLKKIVQRDMDKYKAFVAVGGDGTVHHLINLIYDSDKILGILPAGSGNGFSNELGFGKNIDMLIHKLKAGRWIDVDLLLVNNSVCANVFGLGFDGQVAHLFQDLSGRGFLRYVKTVLQCIRSFRPFHAVVESDRRYSGDFTMIVAANTRQYGNNAIIAPKAVPWDGKYDLILIKKVPLTYIPEFVLRMFAGQLKPSKYIEYIQTDGRTRIRAAFNLYHLDGEPHVCDGGVDISIFSKKVRIASAIDALSM